MEFVFFLPNQTILYSSTWFLIFKFCAFCRNLSISICILLIYSWQIIFLSLSWVNSILSNNIFVSSYKWVIEIVKSWGPINNHSLYLATQKMIHLCLLSNSWWKASLLFLARYYLLHHFIFCSHLWYSSGHPFAFIGSTLPAACERMPINWSHNHLKFPKCLAIELLITALISFFFLPSACHPLWIR